MKPREFVERYGIKSIAYCLSGGKDSLVACHYMERELGDLRDQLERHFITADTTVMIPGNVEWLRKVVRDLFGVELTVLRPQKTFWELVEELGAPKMRSRWCCYHLKLEPIIRFMRALPPQRAEVTGLRRAESRRRAKLPPVILKHKSLSWGYAPILDWTDEQVRAYIREHNLPVNPIYRTPIKETCVCGVFASSREIEAVRALYPELFAKFVEAESRFKSGGAMFYFSNRPWKARDLFKQALLDEFVER